VSPPPAGGKGARPLLVRQLDVARRAAELLDEKRAALVRDERALASAMRRADAALAVALGEAERWWQRAAVVGGRRGARLALGSTAALARVDVRTTERLGVRHAAAVVTLGPVPSTALVGAGGAALALATRRQREALGLAAAAASARESHRRVAAELARTTRRLRAIEWRFIPRHERALAALVLALDEAEREDATRVRWASRRRALRR